MSLRTDCPGCGGARRLAAFRIADQPVVLNYRFPDATAASKVPRRDVDLVQCASCGLIFNASFDADVIPYDAAYENRQCCSPAFVGHLEQLAAGLVRRHRLKGRRILEVGCGKGDFLRMLCRAADATGVGYDTTFEGDAGGSRSRVRFHTRYVTAADVTTEFQLVVCRHVIEHVPEVGKFLTELRAIAVAAGDPVVVLETPAFEWIVKHRCLWDIFYEHCNYFPMATLAHLCRQAGFSVIGHRTAFGGQYQVLELKVRRRLTPLNSPVLGKMSRLKTFSGQARRIQSSLRSRAQRLSRPRGWAVWGAGAKGVALVNLLPEIPPAFVIDSNPAKHGCVIPGSQVPVIGPDDPRIDEVGSILVVNPNYLKEIAATLGKRGYAGTLHALDA